MLLLLPFLVSVLHELRHHVDQLLDPHMSVLYSRLQHGTCSAPNLSSRSGRIQTAFSSFILQFCVCGCVLVCEAWKHFPFANYLCGTGCWPAGTLCLSRPWLVARRAAGKPGKGLLFYITEQGRGAKALVGISYQLFTYCNRLTHTRGHGFKRSCDGAYF